ncbi:MAG: ImmA/IrrE family metallo-endopeptidase [Synechococcales cyanobacterium RM1_1_8]|nr:ImmA/IrrE family metallo-endopeptidase [Synechococcales cyanobacterium RM1_1_8]
MEKARAALRAVRQYQQDWQEHGVNRVHQHFDDVEGNWLENFDEIPMDISLTQDSGVNFPRVLSDLENLGLSKKFIEEAAFPAWWKSDFENDQGRISRLISSVAQRLLLEINLLQGSSHPLFRFVPIKSQKFKLQKGQAPPVLFPFLVRSVANVSLDGVGFPYTPVSSNPLSVRSSILQKSSCVSLESLLDFCWSCGIPAVQLDLSTFFGKGSRGLAKSDGLVVVTDDRPAIVIGSSRKYSAWLLFILAHELGHIAHCHLQEGVLSDESFQDGVKDEEEEAANQFAQQLLFGDFSPRWSQYLNQRTLLKEARRLSKENHLDPGSLILNYGWKTGNWAMFYGSLEMFRA